MFVINAAKVLFCVLVSLLELQDIYIYIYIYYISVQGDHLTGKPGNVREFDSYQENVRDFIKNQGKNRVREKLRKTVYCKLHICIHTAI